MRANWGTALVLAVAWAGAARGDDRAEGKALLEQAIKAHGGEVKLAKFKAATTKGKVTFHIGNRTVEQSSESAVQGGDQRKQVIRSNTGTTTVVVNKDKGWIKVNDGEAKDMDAWRLAVEKETLYLNWLRTLLPLRDKAFTLNPTGEVKVNGRAALGLRVGHEGRADVVLFFDKKTGLLLKAEGTGKVSTSDKEVNQEWFFEDYKEVEGLQVPMKAKVLRDGKTYVETETTEYKPLEKLDAAEFDKP